MRSGKSSQFLLDRTNRFSPKSNEFDPYPYTREAIAYFATSLDLDIRLRQAKSEVYDGAFRKMCRSVYEHPMEAEVGRAYRDIVPPAFIAQMKFGEMLNSRFSTCWD
jgi:hypothetical protein